LLLVTAIVLAVVIFYWLGLYRYFDWTEIRDNIDTLREQARNHLLLALVVFFVVYVSVTALSLPVATVLSLTAGAIFDRWLGTVLVSLSSTSGATLAFLGSRYLFRDWVRQKFGSRLDGIDRGVDRDGAWYLFSLRLTPLVPFFLVNLGMGLTPIRVSTFAGVSWLGMLPATVVFVNAGTALSEIKSPRDVLSPTVLLSLALLGITPLLIRLLLRWWQKV
jgi:uncharacterized membrane protein YdjX (TVP38/TMEM64 family)